MVPLAEAWDSGARTWTSRSAATSPTTSATTDRWSAVTDNVNQTKGDQDPGTWLPQYDQCRYLREFVAVKHRWRLTVDSAEKSAMTSLATSCTNSTITVTLAR